MSVNINVRISDDQAKKISKSGLNKSEYTRNALEYYDVRKQNTLIQYKINIIQDCIDILVAEQDQLRDELIRDAYKNLYKNDENVKHDEEKSLYKNDENVKNLYKNDENSLQFVKKNDEQNLYKTDENVKTMESDKNYPQMKKYLKLISKLLNIHNIVPDDTKKKIQEETTLSKQDINQFIIKHKDELKNIHYEISSKHVKCEPGEKKYTE